MVVVWRIGKKVERAVLRETNCVHEERKSGLDCGNRGRREGTRR